MIQVQVKLKLTKAQERKLNEWLPMLAAIWNWGIRKIELDGMVNSKDLYRKQ